MSHCGIEPDSGGGALLESRYSKASVPLLISDLSSYGITDTEKDLDLPKLDLIMIEVRSATRH